MAQPLVQLIGKALAIFLIEGIRSTGLHTAGTQRIHKIAHRQSFTDGGGRVGFTAPVKRYGFFSSTSAASGISAVITKSPALTRFTISLSATSNPAATRNDDM